MSHESACRLRPGEPSVSWDSETDAEFQQELDWVEEFVGTEIEAGVRFGGALEEVGR
jgi:hypothetical protein